MMQINETIMPLVLMKEDDTRESGSGFPLIFRHLRLRLGRTCTTESQMTHP